MKILNSLLFWKWKGARSLEISRAILSEEDVLANELMKLSYDPYFKVEGIYTLATCIAQHGSYDHFRLMLKHHPITLNSKIGYFPLIYYIAIGSRDVKRKLLFLKSKGRDLNPIINANLSLVDSLIYTDNISSLVSLHEAGVSFNKLRPTGNVPIKFARIYGKFDVANTLLSCGAKDEWPMPHDLEHHYINTECLLFPVHLEIKNAIEASAFRCHSVRYRSLSETDENHLLFTYVVEFNTRRFQICFEAVTLSRYELNIVDEATGARVLDVCEIQTKTGSTVQRIIFSFLQESTYEKESSRNSETQAHFEKTVSVPWKELCALLGISTNVTNDELKKGYRTFLKKNHPDLFQNAGVEIIKECEMKIKKVNALMDICYIEAA